MLTQKQLGQRIKAIRVKRELSQEQLAKIIGISRAAISEIERGNRGLDTLELVKIARCFGLGVDELLKDRKDREYRKARLLDKKSGVIVNKHIKFKPEKLRQVISYILSKCGGKSNFGQTVLYKILYYIDFDAYEVLGKSVTGLNYIHQKFGPIPQLKQYQPIIQDMKKNQEVKIFNQNYYGMIQKRYVALVDYKLDDFSAKEKDLIDKVLKRLSDMGAKQIEEYVHSDAPWKFTKNNEIISYDLVIERKSPYAHRNYDKAWQNIGAGDTLKGLGKISNKEFTYYKEL